MTDKEMVEIIATKIMRWHWRDGSWYAGDSSVELPYFNPVQIPGHCMMALISAAKIMHIHIHCGNIDGSLHHDAMAFRDNMSVGRSEGGPLLRVICECLVQAVTK